MKAFRVAALACALMNIASTALAAPSVQASEDYLTMNARKSGVVTVPGIQYRIIKSGAGRQPQRADCATVYYKGSFIDGKIFDQTHPGQPVTFPVGGVIGGWTEALQMMHVGDKWEVVIPSGLAYGPRGTSDGTIPGGQTLVFEIELLKAFPSNQGDCS